MTSPEDLRGAVELLPCPFCGDRFVHAEQVKPDSKLWGIHCPNGQCPSAGNFMVTDFSEAEVIAAWNTRFLIAAAQPLEAGDRVAIAQIIDPMAFWTLDEWRTHVTQSGWLRLNAEIARQALAEFGIREHDQEAALAKADAILALSPPPSDHPVSEPLEAAGDVVERMARAMEPSAFETFDGGYTQRNAHDTTAFLNAEKTVKRARKKAEAALAAIQSPSLGTR